jgi:hypothetical protein
MRPNWLDIESSRRLKVTWTMWKLVVAAAAILIPKRTRSWTRRPEAERAHPWYIESNAAGKARSKLDLSVLFLQSRQSDC